MSPISTMRGFRASVDSATRSTGAEILGVVVVAIDREGHELIAHSSGKTSLDPDASPVDNTSVFRLASCTKLITAIALLRLLSLPPWSSQPIAIHLDDASLIDAHLPELIALEVITSAPGNKNIAYTPRTVPLTLRHLLTHTSGVGYDMIDPRLRAWRKSRKEKMMTLHGPLPESVSTPLLFQPGEGWAYGGGLDWVGVFVERASGTKFGEWIREHVFNVLGCDAGVGFARDAVQEAGSVVQVVTKGKDGRLKEQKVKDQDAGVERGGGGLYASASNMAKVLADVVSPNPKLLGPEIADALFAPQLLPGSPALNALQASAANFRSMSGPLTPSNDVSGINHALGGMLVTKDSEELGKTKGTMTWGGAFNCMWFANRERGVAGFYGSSMFPPGEGKSGELMGEFLREVWGFEAVGAGSIDTISK